MAPFTTTDHTVRSYMVKQKLMRETTTNTGVNRHRETSESRQRHLQKYKKQTVKWTEKTNKKNKTNVEKICSTKQIPPLVNTAR